MTNNSAEDAMAKLAARDQQYREAAFLAWAAVLDAFKRKLTMNDPEVVGALAAYQTASALQIATAEEMLQLLKDLSPGPAVPKGQGADGLPDG